MLSGAERTELLWNLTDNLARLNRKLRLLAVSITMHSFEDVWNRAINGMIGKSNKNVSSRVFETNAESNEQCC